MYRSDRQGIPADHVTSAIGAIGSARSLRTARSVLIFIAVVAALVGFFALVLIHQARPEVVLVLGAPGIWMGSLWYVERRALDREVHEARVRLLDARGRQRRRVPRDLHGSAQQRTITLRIRLASMPTESTSADDRERLEQLGRELDDAIAATRSVTRAGSPELRRQFGVPSWLRSSASTS